MHINVHTPKPIKVKFGRTMEVGTLSNVTLNVLGMYRIAIFKSRPEPDSTRYQTNYPAGTGYRDTCCIIANFFGLLCDTNKKCIIPYVCAHTLHRSTTSIICKTVGLHDSLVL